MIEKHIRVVVRLVVAGVVGGVVVGLVGGGPGHGVDCKCAFVVCCVKSVFWCRVAALYEIRAKIVRKNRPIWGFALFYLSILCFWTPGGLGGVGGSCAPSTVVFLVVLCGVMKSDSGGCCGLLGSAVLL